jgi:hypothetical protein
MRTYAIAATLICLFWTLPVELRAAEKVALGAGVFCVSASAVNDYIHASEIGDHKLAEATPPEASCFAAAAAYYEREPVSSVRAGVKTFRVERITVVAVFHNGLLVSISPKDQYIAVLEPGVEV